MSTDRTTPLVQVAWRAGGWLVLVGGVARRTFAYRVDAEEAALRLARKLGVAATERIEVLFRCGARATLSIA